MSELRTCPACGDPLDVTGECVMECNLVSGLKRQPSKGYPRPVWRKGGPGFEPPSPEERQEDLEALPGGYRKRTNIQAIDSAA
jgi:hypothetical protein